jgi:aspartyl protease family protein
MATGFMRHSSLALLGWMATHVIGASAANVTVVGLFPGKAVVVINGQPPRTISAGQKTAEGIVLLSTAADSAVLEIDGKKQTLELGQHFAPASSSGPSTVAIAADSQGHHWVMGQVNGKSTRFLVDTGATTVTLPAGLARAAGIEYTKGQSGAVQTANGVAPAYRVRVDTISVGDITMYQVDAIVLGTGLDSALLGMSFLNRTDIKRDGANLVLTKRF